MLVWLALTLVANPVAAQTTTTYSNTTTGTINAATTCTAPLVRNFTVGTGYTVGDVDLGLLATHSWRGDLRVTLQSPAGTRVQLVDGDTGSIDGNNFNVHLADDAAQAVNSDGNGTRCSTWSRSRLAWRSKGRSRRHSRSPAWARPSDRPEGRGPGACRARPAHPERRLV